MKAPLYSSFKISIVLFALLSINACKTIKIPGEDPMGRLTADIAYLASDLLEGRETGTVGEEKAAEFIVSRFKEIGLQPMGDKNSYLQYYERKMRSNPHAEQASDDDPVIKTNNVIGYINNNAAHTVVIGGHYDHLGYGAEGSLYTGPAEIHNGADDNASGVAGVLYLAELLNNNPKANKYNYAFIAFSGEEKGLWGSNYFVDHPTFDLSKVSFMINLDMVGRLNEDRKLAISGTGTSPVWDKLLAKHGKSFSLKKSPSGIGPSDHTSFYLADIPVLFFFTGQHADYHKPSDDIHLINFTGLRDISQYLYKIIISAQKNGKLPFTKTKDDQEETPNFNITLGVMPDYLYDGKGMRIDGVSEGRTAFKHDFLAGDVVLKMGDVEVLDMKTYMVALGKYHPGDTIDILIKRNGKKMVKKVTF